MMNNKKLLLIIGAILNLIAIVTLIVVSIVFFYYYSNKEVLMEAIDDGKINYKENMDLYDEYEKVRDIFRISTGICIIYIFIYTVSTVFSLIGMQKNLLSIAVINIVLGFLCNLFILAGGIISILCINKEKKENENKYNNELP